MNDAGPQAHERERLTRWVCDHGRPVLGYLMALVRDRDLADDLVQEVFCRAWEARRRYREAGRERAYLLRIADRLACDWARRPRREMTVDGEDWQQIEPAQAGAPPWQQLESAEERQELQRALDTLSEPQRRTLLLRYYGQMEFSEIANLMDCPLNTVLSHARRGLLALKRLLVEKIV